MLKHFSENTSIQDILDYKINFFLYAAILTNYKIDVQFIKWPISFDLPADSWGISKQSTCYLDWQSGTQRD